MLGMVTYYLVPGLDRKRKSSWALKALWQWMLGVCKKHIFLFILVEDYCIMDILSIEGKKIQVFFYF